MDLSPIHSSETIYFGVCVNGKREEIMKQVKAIVDEYVKPTEERQRDKKWKYYLIAYDFVDKGMKYSKIADILSVAFEHDKRLFDEKNIENYYKTGLKLINDGYKKYLYLKK